MDDLINEIKNELTDELKASGIDFDSESTTLLESKVRNAYRTIKNERNYQEHHDDEFILKDMAKMHSIISDLSLYDFNKIGAEGERTHAENGTSRTWVNRNSILSRVIPFATVL